MSLRAAVKRVILGSQSATVVVECRHCGTNVDPDTDRCPECGATERNRYEL